MFTYTIGVNLTDEQLEVLDELDSSDVKRIALLIQHYKYSFEEAVDSYEDLTDIYEDSTMVDVAEYIQLEYFEMDRNPGDSYDDLLTIDYEQYASELLQGGGFHIIGSDIIYAGDA